MDEEPRIGPMGPLSATVYLLSHQIKDAEFPSTEWLYQVDEETLDAYVLGDIVPEDTAYTVMLLKSLDNHDPGALQFTEAELTEWLDQLNASLIMERMRRFGVVEGDSKSIFDDTKTWTKADDFEKKSEAFIQSLYTLAELASTPMETVN